MPAALPTIRVLPPVVANQIAAGEVVTRPASVVKELVENALDAAASKVRIEIEGGGADRIVVADDGHGMRREDAMLALRRHATSKIESADDLGAIQTLGFRGEALPSIASVSRFTLRTRPTADELGTELRIEGGELLGSAPCGCGPGTVVEVADLFFNVPARRKFQRARSTESAHVTEVALSAALAHPTVALTLVRDGREARQWLRSTDRPERVAQVLPDHQLTPCLGTRGPVSVEAYLAGPDRARAGAAGLRVFVNDRPIQDRALCRAVAAAYGPALDQGRYPIGAVFVRLPSDLVDVNVHPQKAEVRFAHARAVTDALYTIVRAELERQLGLPPTGPPAGTTSPAPQWRERSDHGAHPVERAGASDWVWTERGAVAAAHHDEAAARAVSGDASSPVAPSAAAERLVTRLRSRFLVIETAEGLLVVDEPAARRRVAHDQMSRGFRQGELPSQRLLFPVVQEVSGAVVEAVARAAEQLDRLGFDLRPAGAGSLSLHALPQALGPASAQRLLVALVEQVERCRGRLDDAGVESLIAAVARHAAPPGQEPEPEQQALDLLRRLERIDGGSRVLRRLSWSDFGEEHEDPVDA